MDYKYPLFFEAKDLEYKEKAKIRRHFQKRRDSGGGECGEIEKVGDKRYKVCFKDQEDQERVLQRKKHTISLPSGDLCLTVSRTNAPEPLPRTLPTSSTKSSSTTTTATASTSTSPEKICPMDIYLLNYVRDTPKALKILQKQLSCIGCSVEFDYDEEVAVVKKNEEKGVYSSAEGKWELQVDQILNRLAETYLCYHVMEPKKAKLVMQDKSLTEDEVKVYSESGYAVIVGEASVVNEKVKALEKYLLTRKELPIDEKQYKLIEEELTREIRTNCPEVQIQKHNNVLTLEGPEAEVQLGFAKHDELIKKVKQKRVQFSTELMNFFTSSGANDKYQLRFQQSLRNPVSLEANADLVLLSLSSEALDEAEVTLKRDLSIANVQLQGNAAVPSELDRAKEMLMKRKDMANIREHKIDVSFIPGPNSTTVVQLVGYSEHVNKLKEVLLEYQINHVTVQEMLNLPKPEMVDCFGKLLNMIGFKQPQVSFKPSHFPYPCVMMTGPRSLVQKTQQALNTALSSLVSDKLVLDGPGARQYFSVDGKASKDLIENSNKVIIQELQDGNSLDKQRSVSCPASPASLPAILSTDRVRRNTVGCMTVDKTSLEIKLGSLVDEQVNVLVVPMMKKELTSTQIGKCLCNKAGIAMKMKFNSAAKKWVQYAGGVLEVVAPPSLGCSKLFFIECLPWDGVRGPSVQALVNGLKRCLDLCVQQKYTSVAFPVIGPGIVLKYPLSEAIQVLTKEIKQFGLTASSSSVVTIHVVIKPDDPTSEECYHEVYRQLGQNMNQAGQAIFRSLTSDLDDVSITLGSGIQMQLVFGDITNERPDAVVNTTDFVNFNDEGVCKDILAVAGPEVEAELKSAKVSKGEIFVTQPGQFPCQGLLHVCGEKSADMVEQLVGSIVQYCEVYGWRSVAIPAICAGTGGLDPGVVAGAILRGLKNATALPLNSLVKVRLVFLKIRVFLAFKEEATQMFLTAVINRVVPPPFLHPPEPQPAPPASLALNMPHTSSLSQTSVFMFTGCSRNDVTNGMKTFKELYERQCSTHTFKKEELAQLSQGDQLTLWQRVESLGLQFKSDRGDWTVSGLTGEVNKLIILAHGFMQGLLVREVRIREEEDLYGRVAWCTLGTNGNWERLPKTANYQLENKDTAAGIKDAQGIQWDVDLVKMESTNKFSTHKTNLKRLQNLPDFTFPLYWDNMAADEVLTVVALVSSSTEYQNVKEGFKRTCNKSVLKIERVQNIHLRRGYEAQKKQISDKNKQSGGAYEKMLYHGTTQENCNSIMKTGFNSRFSGQNATSYGHGTYFAINANYSAHPNYSKPAMDGTQLMFVAQVLTGLYTQGTKDMRVPPPRDPQQPHDRYDSVVDKVDSPSMYVVFHDNQAYPDYLITFK